MGRGGRDLGLALRVALGVEFAALHVVKLRDQNLPRNIFILKED
jgi:hypothetical protein